MPDLTPEQKERILEEALAVDPEKAKAVEPIVREFLERRGLIKPKHEQTGESHESR